MSAFDKAIEDGARRALDRETSSPILSPQELMNNFVAKVSQRDRDVPTPPPYDPRSPTIQSSFTELPPIIDLHQDPALGGPPDSQNDVGPSGPAGPPPGLVASATALGTGDPPTATIFPTGATGNYHVKFGIPPGPRGPTGPPFVPVGFTGATSITTPAGDKTFTFTNGMLLTIV